MGRKKRRPDVAGEGPPDAEPRPPAAAVPAAAAGGFSNDGNFLNKFVATQQRLGLAPAQQPPPAGYPPAQHHAAAYGHAPPYGAAGYQAAAYGAAGYNGAAGYGAGFGYNQGAAAFNQWPSAAPAAYARAAAAIAQPPSRGGAVPSSSAPAQPPPQLPPLSTEEKLAAGGWKKCSTPEGDFWTNEITGETSTTEPAAPSVLLVQSRGRAAAGPPTAQIAPKAAAPPTPAVPAAPPPPSAEAASAQQDPAAASSAAVKSEQPAEASGDQPPQPPSQQPPPAPPGVHGKAVQVIEKLSAAVAKNGLDFEKILRQKNQGDPTFSFLFHTESVAAMYYHMVLRFERAKLKIVGQLAADAKKPAAAGAEKQAGGTKERRKRRWGPVSEQSDDATRTSAWDTPLDSAESAAAEKAAAEKTAKTAAKDQGEEELRSLVGTEAADGWWEHKLVDGRAYFHHPGKAYSVWVRPIHCNARTRK